MYKKERIRVEISFKQMANVLSHKKCLEGSIDTASCYKVNKRRKKILHLKLRFLKKKFHGQQKLAQDKNQTKSDNESTASLC